MNSFFNTSLPQTATCFSPSPSEPRHVPSSVMAVKQSKKALAERLESDNLLDRLLQRLSVRLASTLSPWGGRTQRLSKFTEEGDDEDTGRGHITRSHSRSTERES